jgi:hypothetical protein
MREATLSRYPRVVLVDAGKMPGMRGKLEITLERSWHPSKHGSLTDAVYTDGSAQQAINLCVQLETPCRNGCVRCLLIVDIDLLGDHLFSMFLDQLELSSTSHLHLAPLRYHFIPFSFPDILITSTDPSHGDYNGIETQARKHWILGSHT